MKISFLLFSFLFIFGFFSIVARAQDFSGTWKTNDEKVSFTLEIKQNGKQISGAYSYVVLPSATRIRAGKFTGKIEGETAEISFQNDEYKTEKGAATIQLITETLIWNMPENIAEVLQIPAEFELEKQFKDKQ